MFMTAASDFISESSTDTSHEPQLDVRNSTATRQ